MGRCLSPTFCGHWKPFYHSCSCRSFLGGLMLCLWLLPVCEGQSERQLHTRAGFQSEGPLAPTRRIDTPCVIGFGDYAQTLLPTLSCSVFTYYSPAHPRTEESTSNRTSNAARKTRSQLPKPSPSLKVYSDTTFRRVGPSLDIDCPLARNIGEKVTVRYRLQCSTCPA